MRRKVVCFDLDDTLYKEVDFLISAYRQIAELIEVRTTMTNVFPYMYNLWEQGRDVFGIIEQESNGEFSKAELLELYRGHKPNISLSEGAEQLLDALINRGCILGIITDGRSITQRNKIEALGLRKWFEKDNIIISEEFGSGKTDDRNFCFFEDRYPGCRYYYVGDNPCKDFIMPNKLGWDTYCINDCTNENIHKADAECVEQGKRPSVYVDSLAELVYKIVPPLENDFILPLMEDVRRDETQVGTCFVAGEYLITAAHVFYDNQLTELQYLFDGRQCLLRLEEAHFDGYKQENQDGFSRDCLVFIVNHKGSPFSLNNDIVSNLRCRARGYYYDGERLRINDIEVSVYNADFVETNCLLVTTMDYHFIKGNSGCPVFYNDIIYGLLWRGPVLLTTNNDGKSYRIVDSRYIQAMINN